MISKEEYDGLGLIAWGFKCWEKQASSEEKKRFVEDVNCFAEIKRMAHKTDQEEND